MAHVQIEYSANLEGEVDIQALCEVMRAAMAGHDAFPLAGVRVRAYAAQYYAIADGNPDHAFIDIHVRLREGRAHEVKKDATEVLFAAARDFLLPVMSARSLALSLEMRDIVDAYSPKMGTIRDYMA